VEAEAEAEALPPPRRPETPAVLADDAAGDTENEEVEVSSKLAKIPPCEIVFVVVRCFAPCAFAVRELKWKE